MCRNQCGQHKLVNFEIEKASLLLSSTSFAQGWLKNGANGGIFAVKPVDFLVLGTFATSYFVKEAKAVLQNQAYFKKVKKLKPNISFQNEPGLR